MEPAILMPMTIIQVSTWDDLLAAIEGTAPGSSVTVELTQDIPAAGSDAVPIMEGRNITLTSGAGGPFTLYQETVDQRHFLIHQGVLTLQNVILSGNQANIAGNHGGVAFSVAPLAQQLHMEAGSVIANNRSSQGGGVFMVGTNAVFTMTGGMLRDNVSTENGGGVSVTGGSTFIINSGDIEANAATSSGGGVHVVGSRFTMLDGNICDNRAIGGGGVFTTGPSTIADMQGGMIQGNRVTADGGGVSVQGASRFTMTGGTIYDNSANNGGGVNVLGLNSRFELEGGLISSNGATLLGGGVHVFGQSSFTMRDGDLAGNDAGNSGGGVNVVGTGSHFIMEDGDIYENTALGAGVNFGGGGVNIQSGTFNMHGGLIRNNHAERNGGGVRRGLLAVDAHFNMHGGVIRDNTALGGGGGLFAQGEVYRPVLSATAYPRIAIAPEAVFSGNRAGTGAFRPPDTAAIDNRIATTSATLFHHPINNFDINFIYEPRVTELTITYQTDARGSFHPPGAPDVRAETIPVDTAPFPFHLQNVPTVTAATGFGFTGWVRDGYPTLLTDAEVRALPIADDTVFTAQYADTHRLVTFYWNYNREEPIYLQETMVYGAPVPHPADPVRSGFVFQGWYLDPEGSLPYDFHFPLAANLSLYASWTPTLEPPEYDIHHAFLIGYPNGLIRPPSDITRAEVASIFLRILSDEQRGLLWMQTNPHPDVALYNWFNNAVSTTSNAGLFTGLPSGHFAPNQTMTRGELATVVARFTGIAYTGADLFSDIGNHWARAAINAVADAGWIYGPAGLGGQFLPDDPISRGETAAVINRMLDRLPEGLEDLLDGMHIWPDNANPDAWYFLYIQEASNSHTYVRKADGVHEKWVQLVPNRPWALLQRPDARPEDIF